MCLLFLKNETTARCLGNIVIVTKESGHLIYQDLWLNFGNFQVALTLGISTLWLLMEFLNLVDITVY